MKHKPILLKTLAVFLTLSLGLPASGRPELVEGYALRQSGVESEPVRAGLEKVLTPAAGMEAGERKLQTRRAVDVAEQFLGNGGTVVVPTPEGTHRVSKDSPDAGKLGEYIRQAAARYSFPPGGSLIIEVSEGVMTVSPHIAAGTEQLLTDAGYNEVILAVMDADRQYPIRHMDFYDGSKFKYGTYRKAGNPPPGWDFSDLFINHTVPKEEAKRRRYDVVLEDDYEGRPGYRYVKVTARAGTEGTARFRSSAARSDVFQDIGGRSSQEDAYGSVEIRDPEGQLISKAFLVLDGMGGLAAGEVASRTALETLRVSLSGDELSRLVMRYSGASNLDEEKEFGRRIHAQIAGYIRSANQRLIETAESMRIQQMGTTLLLALLLESKTLGLHADLFSVGDSPSYHYRAADRRVDLLTVEDTVYSGVVQAELIQEGWLPSRALKRFLWGLLGIRTSLPGAITRESFWDPKLLRGDPAVLKLLARRLRESRSGLTNFLGPDKVVEGVSLKVPLDVKPVRVLLKPGDVVLLASDGISNGLSYRAPDQDEIAHLERIFKEGKEQSVSALVNAVGDLSGGQPRGDNRTAYAILAADPNPAAGTEQAKKLKPGVDLTPTVVGSHPFLIEIYGGPKKARLYVADAQGSIRRPAILLPSEGMKRWIPLGTVFPPELITPLAILSPAEVVRDYRHSSEFREIVLLKGIIDRAKTLPPDALVQAAVSHLAGPYSPSGEKSYRNLLRYLNLVLRSDPVLGVAQIGKLRLWLIKEGGVSEVFQVEIELKDRRVVRFAVNISRDLTGAADALKLAFQALRVDHEWDHRSVIEPFDSGTGKASFWAGRVEVPAFVSEWVDFHELHLYAGPDQDAPARFSVWWDQDPSQGTPLPVWESDQIWQEFTRVLMRYWKTVQVKDGTATRQATWAPLIDLNAGDLVGRRRPDGKWEVLLIWDRSPGPVTGAAAASFILNGLLQYAADFSQRPVRMVWWDRPEMGLEILREVFINNAVFRAQKQGQDIRQAREQAQREFRVLLWEARGDALPTILANPAPTLGFWNLVDDREKAKAIRVLRHAQDAVGAFFLNTSAGTEQVWKEAVERMDGYRSVIQEPGIVVIGESLAKDLPGFQILAGMEDRVVIERGAADTAIRLAERGIRSAQYFGGIQEARDFQIAASGLEISVIAHTPDNPEFRLLLPEVLQALGVPEGLAASGVEEFAAGLETLAEAA